MIELQKKSPKILVIGDLMIDHYLWGSCDLISPEAPVQVMTEKVLMRLILNHKALLLILLKKLLKTMK